MLYIGTAWASTLLILGGRQCEGLNSGVSNSLDSHAFSIVFSWFFTRRHRESVGTKRFRPYDNKKKQKAEAIS